MAKRESMGEALARLDFGQKEAWKLELQELVATFEVRPSTAVLRVEAGGARRVYRGWRAHAIAEVLDACAAIDGDWWIGKAQLVDSRGRRYKGYTKKTGSHMAWRQANEQAAKQNSRKQAKAFRERAREEWHDYCKAYQEKFPGHPPIGFDRWCRGARKVWLESGPDAIQFNELTKFDRLS